MERSKRLGTENPAKLLLMFSMPAIVGLLVQACYNVTNRIFIGNTVGSLGIAGITVGFPAMMIQVAFGAMVGMGATTLVSIRLGQGRKEEAERVMGNAVVLLFITSLLITAFGFTFMEPMLRLFGASDAVLPYAREYMEIVILGTVFGLLSFGMNNFLRAEGNPGKAMVTMLISSICNIILTFLFVTVFKWGMRGSAFATIISQAASASWIITHFALGKGELKIRRKNFRLQRGLVTTILFMGLSPFAMQFAQSFLGGLLNNSLKTYGGDLAISGMGIVMTLMSLIVMPIIGVNGGAQPIVGYNFGARKYERVMQVLKYALLGATAIAVFGFIMTRIYSVQLITLFNRHDAELIAFGSRALLVYTLAMPIIGLQMVGAGFFQAIGKPVHSMLLSLSRQVLVFIPCLLILPRFFGLDGILYAGPVADTVSTIITVTWLIMELSNLKRKHRGSVTPDGSKDGSQVVDSVFTLKP
ncbi:MAG: MATE family efflux transporter [Syntrophomonadaceae bacterium]|nr:MATE family efflux transporter [Syntrophomonadaceae bacterium]